MSIYEEYTKNGFYIKKNVLSSSDCLNIIEQLNNIKTDMLIPHTNIQFGYGNIINNKLSKYIVDNSFIKEFCKELYGNKYYYNSLYVHNKHKWVGPDVEWHQEVFNIKTFHPTNNSYSLEDIKQNFMQVYVALEDQTLENGCLKIIPYQDSILKHYDTLNTHLNHKRAIDPNELDKLYDSHGIINLELKAGDVVFFNHLIPHGSSSNNGPFNRKAMVFLTYKNNDEIDETIREKEKQYRKDFSLNYLKKILNTKSNQQIYQCGTDSKDINVTWSDLFEKLPWYNNNFKEDYSIESLLNANGHGASKAGSYTIDKWCETIDNIKKYLNYDDTKKNNIIEVGCGAGALLKYFETDKNNLFGIEPSISYMKIVKQAIKNGDFLLGDALKIESYKDNFFDYILCYSTIQYFPDMNYLNNFIKLCFKKLKVGGKLFIGDILNKDTEQDYLNFRISKIGEKEYKEKYLDTNLTHFYIPKSEIKNIMKDFKYIYLTDSEKRGDEIDFYRFNYYCLKSNCYLYDDKIELKNKLSYRPIDNVYSTLKKSLVCGTLSDKIRYSIFDYTGIVLNYKDNSFNNAVSKILSIYRNKNTDIYEYIVDTQINRYTNSYYMYLYLDNNIIGMVRGGERNLNVELSNIYIMENYRNNKYAFQMLSVFIKFLKNINVEEIGLITYSDNIIANKLYNKLNFEIYLQKEDSYNTWKDNSKNNDGVITYYMKCR